MNFLQLVRCWAVFSASFQDVLASLSSASTDLLQLFLGLPGFLFPCGFQVKASLDKLEGGFLRGRWRRLSSSASLESPEVSPSAEARVLVINTGGTIGMMYHNNVLCPEPNAFVKTLRKLPILHDEQYAQQTRLYEFCPYDNTLVLPLSKQNKRIVYTVLEYCPLLDSCNMTTDDWAHIGKDIEKHYEKYDGFVVLHGTDTMAYTASALSFMCEHLGKPIILTGSQVPIYEMRNDGRDNLLGALLIAGQFCDPRGLSVLSSQVVQGESRDQVDIKINWDTVWRANTTA
ncbi:hypothetical protein SKAU_G00337080 [Synaphobranchus kaupii]|uniref:L-asparaginase N-terminal domain-containing protein n=1 Tax=Synaphobranchus kaupii TaxID=118154 RepID=A0A9Q1IIU2_SYNKA|nr:hypothetical protein SKAU_G00337080 [Synaphobranchus kaupii]